MLCLFKIGQVCRPLFKAIGFWESIKELARAYEYIMGLLLFAPIAILSWFPFVSEFQTRLLFNQAFSRGLQISMILAGRKDKTETEKKWWHVLFLPHWSILIFFSSCHIGVINFREFNFCLFPFYMFLKKIRAAFHQQWFLNCTYQDLICINDQLGFIHIKAQIRPLSFLLKL